MRVLSLLVFVGAGCAAPASYVAGQRCEVLASNR
jgi:hypothetical protein